MTDTHPMKSSLTRADFLKVCSLALAGAFFPRLPGIAAPYGMLGRVTRRSVEIKAQPDAQSKTLRKVERDTLLSLAEEIMAPVGAQENPRWYRLSQGFVHSAYIQRVDEAHQNTPLTQVPAGGLLGEVSMPYTQSLYQNRQGQMVKLYRLYYQSLHWITGLVEGPDGAPWYRLTDEWLRIAYFAPSTDLRVLPAEELSPLSTSVPSIEKRIEVSLADQHLTAYEGSRPVFQVPVSTGIRYMETPQGEFQVNRKCPSKHMGNGGVTGDLNAYELVGVPWATFFSDNGVAFHGTFWHDNFGTPMSHGCVNLRTADARWLFRWCEPLYPAQAGFRLGRSFKGTGTTVIID